MVEDLVLTLRNAVERYQLMTEISQLRARVLVSNLKPQKEASLHERVTSLTVAEVPEGSEALPDESGPLIADAEVTFEQAELAINGLSAAYQCVNDPSGRTNTLRRPGSVTSPSLVSNFISSETPRPGRSFV